jgi:hypothetical protein
MCKANLDRCKRELSHATLDAKYGRYCGQRKDAFMPISSREVIRGRNCVVVQSIRVGGIMSLRVYKPYSRRLLLKTYCQVTVVFTVGNCVESDAHASKNQLGYWHKICGVLGESGPLVQPGHSAKVPLSAQFAAYDLALPILSAAARRHRMDVVPTPSG